MSDPPAIAAIHLDAVGGIAGDMFVAAMLDACPDLWCRTEEAVAAMEPPPGLRYALEKHADGILTGMRFKVAEPLLHDTGHDHAHWSDIRAHIGAAVLDGDTRAAALGIFAVLAEAEAAVHGVGVDDAAFHEVGAWDSIVDIVAAAAIISGIGPCRWSVGPIPRGRGLVRTAHGMLPLPAPAVVRLLEGFALVDDEEEGERVTPTGAAILKYLGATQVPDPAPRRLLGAGHGFGTRTLKTRSNVLRAGIYAEAEAGTVDEIEVLRCEIDDQSPEDLAVALDHIRAAEGVLDVCQWPVHAKKGRIAMSVQVLVRPEAADAVTALCLDETTSLGIRRRRERRTVVLRESRDAGAVRTKLARRPGGLTAKAEIDDVSEAHGHKARSERRSEAEAAALREDLHDVE